MWFRSLVLLTAAAAVSPGLGGCSSSSDPAVTPGAGNDAGARDSGNGLDSSNTTAPRDCSGQFTGPISGSITLCFQSAITESDNGVLGKTSHAFIAYSGLQPITVTFSFEQEPPSPGTFDATNLQSYDVAIGAAFDYGVEFDKRYPPTQDDGGLFSLHLMSVNGGTLTGTLDVVAPAVRSGPGTGTDGGAASVSMHLDFPAK